MESIRKYNFSFRFSNATNLEDKVAGNTFYFTVIWQPWHCNHEHTAGIQSMS